jgi:hypothetical protein
VASRILTGVTSNPLTVSIGPRLSRLGYFVRNLRHSWPETGLMAVYHPGQPTGRSPWVRDSQAFLLGGRMERTACCHCGSLRATVSGEPAIVNVCHCKPYHAVHLFSRLQGESPENGSFIEFGWRLSRIFTEKVRKRRNWRLSTIRKARHWRAFLPPKKEIL